MENRDIVRTISEAFQQELPSTSRADEDAPIPFRGHEVELNGEWIPSSSDTWRAWCGRRRLWGIEFHGDVYAIGSPDGTTPWTGPRTCPCEACQRHVTPENRYN